MALCHKKRMSKRPYNYWATSGGKPITYGDEDKYLTHVPKHRRTGSYRGFLLGANEWGIDWNDYKKNWTKRNREGSHFHRKYMLAMDSKPRYPSGERKTNKKNPQRQLRWNFMSKKIIRAAKKQRAWDALSKRWEGQQNLLENVWSYVN